MAKRPIKKRKPRKVKLTMLGVDPRDLTPRRALNIFAPKPKVPLNPRFRLKVGSDGDPFYIDQKTVPAGVALQWITLNVDDLERAQSSGWKPVEGVGGVRGNMLVWAPVAVADAQRDANIKRAKDQMREAKESLGLNGRREGRLFPIAPQSFMVSSAYETVPSDTGPIDIDVTVKLRLSGRLQDVAAALKLSPEVYAQRRMELYMRGDIAGLLLPSSTAKCLELYETGNFSLTPRNN